jgi:branched-chain amino acid transport system permease protein
MAFLLQLSLSGLAVGGIYSLIAVGFSLTFATSRTVNFSQGQSMMLGAVLWYWLLVTLRTPGWLALLMAVALGAVFGLVVARVAVFPFLGQVSGRENGWLLSTIAVGIIAQNVVQLSFGSETRALPSFLGDKPLPVLGVGVMPHDLVIISAGIVTAVALEILLYHTLAGTAFRAVAVNPRAARLIGVDTHRMTALAYVLSSALAAIAGVLVAPILNVSASMGTIVGTKAFAVAAISGMIWPVRIFALGLCFGVMESLIAGYFGIGAREMVAFASLILLLAWRPSGLFQSRQRVI